MLNKLTQRDLSKQKKCTHKNIHSKSVCRDWGRSSRHFNFPSLTRRHLCEQQRKLLHCHATQRKNWKKNFSPTKIGLLCNLLCYQHHPLRSLRKKKSSTISGWSESESVQISLTVKRTLNPNIVNFFPPIVDIHSLFERTWHCRWWLSPRAREEKSAVDIKNTHKFTSWG